MAYIFPLIVWVGLSSFTFVQWAPKKRSFSATECLLSVQASFKVI